MIRVKQLVSLPAGGDGLRLAPSGVSAVTIPVRDLGKALGFYSRVFGFRPASGGQQEPRRSATMTGPGGALLAIHEYSGESVRPVPIRRQWGFLVEELDHVRETIWDLGVRVASDGGEPDHSRRWSNGRSLRVRDPDGNEIELVEEADERTAEFLRRNCPARAAWRRWVRQERCPAR